MKKGFTLIELLAVFVLIGTISAIAFTSINGILEREKVKEYSAKCDLFLINAQDYFNDFKNNIELGEGPEFFLNDLIEAGYARNKTSNPTTNKSFDKDITTFNIDIDDTGKYHINEVENNGNWETLNYEDWCK